MRVNMRTCAYVRLCACVFLREAISRTPHPLRLALSGSHSQSGITFDVQETTKKKENIDMEVTGSILWRAGERK